MCNDIHDLIRFYHSQPTASVGIDKNDGVTVGYEIDDPSYREPIVCEVDVIDLMLFYINNKGK